MPFICMLSGIRLGLICRFNLVVVPDIPTKAFQFGRKPQEWIHEALHMLPVLEASLEGDRVMVKGRMKLYKILNPTPQSWSAVAASDSAGFFWPFESAAMAGCWQAWLLWFYQSIPLPSSPDQQPQEQVVAWNDYHCLPFLPKKELPLHWASTSEKRQLSFEASLACWLVHLGHFVLLLVAPTFTHRHPVLSDAVIHSKAKGMSRQMTPRDRILVMIYICVIYAIHMSYLAIAILLKNNEFFRCSKICWNSHLVSGRKALFSSILCGFVTFATSSSSSPWFCRSQWAILCRTHCYHLTHLSFFFFSSPYWDPWRSSARQSFCLPLLLLLPLSWHVW